MDDSVDSKKNKDFWDKLQIVLHPLNGLLTAIAVAFLGYYTSSVLRQSEARETNERVYTELMSSREQAESGLRKDMFLSIIETFLRPQTVGADGRQADGLEAKMLNLELLTYNFHESLNLKPLFAHMSREIQASGDAGRTQYLKRLQVVAKEIITRQLVLLEQVGEKYSRSVDFDKMKEQHYLELEPEKLTVEGVEREFKLTVFAVDPENRELTIELQVRTTGESSGMQMRRFTISNYDFPMIDNTRLSQDQRAAVVLGQSGADSAEVTLVYFPGSYASLKEKVSYDEVMKKLGTMGQAGSASQ